MHKVALQIAGCQPDPELPQHPGSTGVLAASAHLTKEKRVPRDCRVGSCLRANHPCRPSLAFREKTDDTSGEDNDEKEAVAAKGRKTANSQGRRKGRITRSMANEASSEEAVPPQQTAELGERGQGRAPGFCL